MKGRFQPTTVGNMARDPNGGYVCHEDYEAVRMALSELEAANDALAAQRTQEQYDAMLALRQQGALLRLDEARRVARDALKASNAGGQREP